jgi:hypothetical protein
MKVKELSERITKIVSELAKYTTSITTSYDNMTTRGGGLNSVVDNDLITQNQITSIKEETEAVDREFVEAEHHFKLSGGKSRKQTLQEFILLFFFVAYALFTVSLIIYSKAVGISVLKTFGIMSFMLLMISGIILRYA